jgi:muconolactone delta-isomerase
MNKNKIHIQYMVEFDLPDDFTNEMVDTIPAQRRKVDTYFNSGKLLAYTLAADHSRVWAVFSVETENQLVKLVDKLPLTRYFTYSYREIMFHSTAATFPLFSLN